MIGSTHSPVRMFIVAAAVVASLTGTPAHAVTAPVAKYSLDVRNYGGEMYPSPYMSAVMPQLYVYQGFAYRPGVTTAMYPGVAVAPVEKLKLSASATIAAIDAVYAAAVVPAGGFGRIPIEDAPMTRITVRTPAGTRSITVYMPTFLDPGLDGWVGAEAASARRKLTAALERVEMLDGTSVMYRPIRLEMWRTTFPTDPSTGPGAMLRFRIMPTASETPGCATVSASALPKGANQISRYRLPDGTVTQAAFRPLLPGEKGCRPTS